MKEDILEQLVDDYLQNERYFTRHNLKFKPMKEAIGFETKKDSVASDVDVVGFNPLRKGPDRVWVVSCKSWQAGFNPSRFIADIEKGIEQEKEMKQGKKFTGRPAWKYFRELVKPKWADAFLAEIERLTGTRSFTYVTAVTKLIGSDTKWTNYEMFKQNLQGNPIKILTLDKILQDLYKNINPTVASSDVGRLLQVIKASGWMKRKDSDLGLG
jgi:hypothetical protein